MSFLHPSLFVFPLRASRCSRICISSGCCIQFFIYGLVGGFGVWELRFCAAYYLLLTIHTIPLGTHVPFCHESLAVKTFAISKYERKKKAWRPGPQVCTSAKILPRLDERYAPASAALLQTVMTHGWEWQQSGLNKSPQNIEKSRGIRVSPACRSTSYRSCLSPLMYSRSPLCSVGNSSGTPPQRGHRHVCVNEWIENLRGETSQLYQHSQTK